MQRFSIALVVLIFSSLSLQAQRPSPFDAWDKDKNGKVSIEEMPEPIRKNFKFVDRDEDGFISREEDEAFRSRSGMGKAKKKDQGKSQDVTAIRDIDYAGKGNPIQALDLFLPKGHGEDSEPLPLIVFIHGGGWANGDKASGGNRLSEWVKEGKFAAASINYRLSGEAQWPAQIHDCKAAIRWLRANADGHGIDPDRIGVWGSSAGGHLVAMLGVTGDVGELDGEVGNHVGISSEVTCVVNFYGPSELLTMSEHPGKFDHDAPGSPESRLVGGPLQENPDIAKNASPIHWVSGADQPSLIVHGTKDEVVPYPQSVDLEKALEEAGVPTIFLSVEGGGHGRGFGPTVQEAVVEFLNHHLLGEAMTLEDKTVAAGE
ncbi:MAG: alpha/beta hydrolase [Verrucomicrobiales bacterium]|nr:alpha/beta hydrolase [Verrucomicrobiales bacterium]